MMLATSLLVGVFIISMALFLLPPVRDFVYAKTNKAISIEVRSLFISILFIAAVMSVNDINDKEAEEKKYVMQLSDKAEETIRFFSVNRKRIISEVTSAISQKEYDSAILQSRKYLISDDEEIKNLYSEAMQSFEKENIRARAESEAEKVAKKTTELLAQLKTIPTKEFDKNRTLYQQLLEMDPENSFYKTKVSFYSKKLEALNSKKELNTSIATRESNAEFWTENYKCEEGVVVHLKHIRSDGSTRMRINTGLLLLTDTRNNWQALNTTYTNKDYVFYDLAESMGRLDYRDEGVTNKTMKCKWQG